VSAHAPEAGNDKRAVILSPSLDQARALARFLAPSPIECLAGPLPTEAHSLRPGRGFASQISWADLDPAAHTIVPTGFASTAAAIDRWHSIQLGDVRFDARALRFSDKDWSLSLARQCGIPAPKTWNDLRDASFPVFFKNRTESGTKVRGLLTSAASAQSLPSADLIFQEYVSGAGTIGVAFLAERGEMLAEQCHFEQYSFPGTGGSAITIADIADEEALEATRILLRRASYSGWGLAEYKRSSATSALSFMEINPKMWASLEFTLAVNPTFGQLLFGVDSPRRPIHQMTFWDRAARRGPVFAARHWRQLRAGVAASHAHLVRSTLVGLVKPDP
jgi:hypothetical protein